MNDQKKNCARLLLSAVLALALCVSAFAVPPAVKPFTPIELVAGSTVIDAVLYDSATSRAFAAMLPLQVDLWTPADFARAFDLPRRIADEPRTRDFEEGGLAYWYEGPSVAIFHTHEREETVVPVVTLGKITAGAGFFKNYEGPVLIRLKEK